MQQDQELLSLRGELIEKQKQEKVLWSKFHENEDVYKRIVNRIVNIYNRPLYFLCLLIFIIANFYIFYVYYTSEKILLIPALLGINFFSLFVTGLINIIFSYNSYNIENSAQTKRLKKICLKYSYSKDTQEAYKILRGSTLNNISKLNKETNELQFEISLIEIKGLLKVVKEASKKNIEPLRREAEKSNIQELIYQANKRILSVERGSLTHLQKSILRPIKKELTQIENLLQLGILPASKLEQKSEVNKTNPPSITYENDKMPIKQYSLKPKVENKIGHKNTYSSKPEKKSSKLRSDNAKEIFTQEKKDNVTKYRAYNEFTQISKKKDYDSLVELGNMGEEFILSCEKEAVRSSNFGHLAECIRQVSLYKRNSCGYDILSFDKNGHEIYIEVKTTTEIERTPFYITINEMRKFDTLPNYKIYRIYNFNVAEGKGDIYRIESIDDLNNFFSIAESKFCLKKK